MRALLQRVSRAEVRVEGNVVGSIDGGLVILLGVGVYFYAIQRKLTRYAL